MDVKVNQPRADDLARAIQPFDLATRQPGLRPNARNVAVPDEDRGDLIETRRGIHDPTIGEKKRTHEARGYRRAA